MSNAINRCDVRFVLLSLRAKWAATALSILGITLFTSSIIIMLSISEKSRQEILKDLGEVGINTIIIESKNSIISQQQALSLKKRLHSRATLSVIHSVKKTTVKTKQRYKLATVLQTDNNYVKVQGLRVLHGRALLREDIVNNSASAMISDVLAKSLHVKLHDTININNRIYKTVAIISHKDHLEDFVITPLLRHHYLNERTFYSKISIDVLHEKQTLSILSEIKTFFDSHPNVKKQLSITSPIEVLSQQMKTHNRFNTLIIIIAVFSLLSSGSSIMHMLLSNISEQTREIGLIKALGATESRIISMFLFHALLLSIIGLVVGVILALFFLYLMAFLQNEIVMISFDALFSVSIITLISGILFGSYPALRAAKISPLVALKES